MITKDEFIKKTKSWASYEIGVTQFYIDDLSRDRIMGKTRANIMPSIGRLQDINIVGFMPN